MTRYALSRRGFLGAGAAGALGAAVGRPSLAAAQKDKTEGPNVLVIALEGARADFVGVYDDSDDLAKTPNLDHLSDQSLRFEHATPESMPSVPSRRALITGVRSFPFRDWRATPGWPAIPGWSHIRASQPILTDVLRAGGVTTAYVTDNPFLLGPQFDNVRATLDVWRPLYSQAAYRNFNHPITTPAPVAEANRYLVPNLRGTVAAERMREYVAYNVKHRHAESDYSTARVFAEGMRQLKRLKGKAPFFLVVDAFEPTSPFDPPPRYRNGVTPRKGVLPIMPYADPRWNVEELGLDHDTVHDVRRLYAGEMTFLDAWIGRLLDHLDSLKLADSTAVFLVSTSGVCLGEHGLMGVDPAYPHPEVYEVPFMIRDPHGRRAGDTTGYHAATHDVATTTLGYLGLRAPGKMDGEDLTVLFEPDEDQRAPFPRPYFTFSVADMVSVGNEDWQMVADTQGHQKRLYHTDVDPDHLHELASIHTAKTQALWNVAVQTAGGTLPKFGATKAIRPFQQTPENTDPNDLNGPNVPGNGVIGNG